MSRRTAGAPIIIILIAIAANAAGCGSRGTSTGCTSDTDCGTGETCQEGACAAAAGSASCATDADCAAGKECIGGSCAQKAGTCYIDRDCKAGTHCSVTRNVCVPGDPVDAGTGDTGATEMGNECQSDLQCAYPSPTCVNGDCLSCLQTGCGTGMSCDALSGQCIMRADGGTPAKDAGQAGGKDAGQGGGATDIDGETDAGTPDDDAGNSGTVDSGGGEIDGGGTGCDATGCECGNFCDITSLVCVLGCVNAGDCCQGTICSNYSCITPECQKDADCLTAPYSRCEKGAYRCVECTMDYHCPGSTCDTWSWTCNPREPSDIGGPCEKDDDCIYGYTCLTAVDTGGADTGYVGGYCTQDCTTTYCDSWDADCVTVSSSPRKDLCLLGCYDISDCRPEYTCLQAESYTSVCLPRCDSPGMACETGYSCDKVTGTCDGSQAIGDPCGGAENLCKKGLVCLGPPGQQAHCYTGCDPSSDPFCAGGEVCNLVGSTGYCDSGGSVQPGGDCATEYCVKGHVCTGNETTGFKCARGCDKDDNDPGCGFGERCILLPGEDRLGTCRRGT